MKKLFLTLSIILITSVASFAQKFAYVDTEYILGQIPEYKAAQAELDKISVQWQKEIEAKYTEIDKMYKAYQAEQILLTEEMKKKREADIIAKEKEAKDLQKQRFGVDGELFKKRQELVKPIQDKVYNAVKSVAEKSGYAVIFDRAGDMTMLYANAKNDKSDDVLELMGYKGGKTGSGTGTKKQ
ncbi:MAG: OmpH family outer membrane protein [Bacteroidetes bacterium]|nr:OmpH family outer membrane protein [Bacteroidia bacterium]MBN8695848.1 OmpH family outer membrane protein [Bacteroidota bacterium]